ncbi:MAG: polysaccharide biosynthesis tyrosine autokinase [Anaerolineales bacterium]|nr:polysaccharide biosynthesis tyrosine autokinase [Anaerolineales bacterium]
MMESLSHPNEQSPLLADDLRQYIRLLWRWSWLILLAAMLAGSAAYFTSLQMTPVYEASSTMMIIEAPATQASEAYTAVLTSQRLTQTYAEMIIKKPVLNEVIDRMDLPMDIEELREIISIEPVRDTQLIDIKVEDTDPSRAAAIANEIGIIFAEQNLAMQASRYANTKEQLQIQLDEIQVDIEQVEAEIAALSENPEGESGLDRLESTLAQYRQSYINTLQSYDQVRLAEVETISNVIQAEPADPPEEPIRPRVLMNVALASVVGGMLAVGGVFLIEALDDTLRDPDEINRILDLPVLGMIRKMEHGDAPITIAQPRAPASEDFRSLRTNIQFASVDYPITTILVTSPSPGDGKTTVAVNLAVVLAQGGRKASLIDTDLRRPRIHHHIRISNRWGLTSLFMNDDIKLDTVLRNNKSTNLSVITAGILPPNPAELLGSEKMFQTISEIKNQSDVSVLDSPPLIAVTDAAVLSQHVDGVIVVISAGKTRVEVALHAVKQLRRVGANILGVVLNIMDDRKSSYHYKYESEYSDEYFFERRLRRKDTKSIR